MGLTLQGYWLQRFQVQHLVKYILVKCETFNLVCQMKLIN